MINLPILQSLHIKGYALFPGTDPERPALHIQFKPGLTLVLGTNGIGKTTLVTILYRMLTGPFDIPNLDNRTALGTASLDVASLNAYRSRTFAARVSDNAMQASVELIFTVNDIRVSVIRNLRNLGLQSCTVDESTAIGEEDRYQKEMAKLANVSSFGDWLLILRYIIFYFEDRNSLVWDPSAQRQLLRVLFPRAAVRKALERRGTRHPGTG